LCRWTSITPGQVKVVGKLLHTMPWTNSSTYPHVRTATTHESGRMIISKSVIIVFCQRVHGQVKYERRPSASCFTPCPGQTRSPNQMLRTASTLGSGQMKGSKLKLHERTARTPGQVDYQRRPSARTRCSAGRPLRSSAVNWCFKHLNSFESLAKRCVGRFSHMVDVHPPDFFCRGSSLKTPPVIGASAEMGASAQGRELL
jgi:hypothetical protein